MSNKINPEITEQEAFFEKVKTLMLMTKALAATKTLSNSVVDKGINGEFTACFPMLSTGRVVSTESKDKYSHEGSYYKQSFHPIGFADDNLDLIVFGNNGVLPSQALEIEEIYVRGIDEKGESKDTPLKDLSEAQKRLVEKVFEEVKTDYIDKILNVGFKEFSKALKAKQKEYPKNPLYKFTKSDFNCIKQRLCKELPGVEHIKDYTYSISKRTILWLRTIVPVLALAVPGVLLSASAIKDLNAAIRSANSLKNISQNSSIRSQIKVNDNDLPYIGNMGGSKAGEPYYYADKVYIDEAHTYDSDYLMARCKADSNFQHAFYEINEKWKELNKTSIDMWNDNPTGTDVCNAIGALLYLGDHNPEKLDRITQFLKNGDYSLTSDDKSNNYYITSGNETVSIPQKLYDGLKVEGSDKGSDFGSKAKGVGGAILISISLFWLVDFTESPFKEKSNKRLIRTSSEIKENGKKERVRS